MLLDAATSALDPELVADGLDVFRELAEGGMTMLIATHDPGRPMREPTRRGVARTVFFPPNPPQVRGTSDALRRSETTGKHRE